MKKTSQLKNILQSNELEFLMEAHNGLSAKIVEETGFKGVWGSGLSISAALGVRDNNEASWTQVLEVVEFMSDATTIPILLDGDTGYGNFNNMRRLVKKLEQRGVAGVCIEDKLFPKTNSFIRGEQQPLAEIEEFAGKVKAGCNSRTDDDFCIVARIEALIAGWGLEEALRRASAYHEAGADAILIHSKLSTPDEILAFMKEWGSRCPVVIVPTTYYSTPTQVFRDAGISTVIWANHLIRGAIAKIQDVSAEIYATQTLMTVEEQIVSVKEVFRLQNDQELLEAEKLYLQYSGKEKPKAIILAASRGVELGHLTEEKPKALIEINGKSLVDRMIVSFRKNDIKDISVVRGYKKDKFKHTNITYFDNDDYDITGELYSLWKSREKLHDNLIITYGDIIYHQYILHRLLSESGDIVIVVDSNLKRNKKCYKGDFVNCSREDDKTYDEVSATLKKIQFAEIGDGRKFDGEWIGLVKSTKAGTDKIRKAMDELSGRETFKKMKMPDLFHYLIKASVDINVMYIDAHWIDIDNYQDLTAGYGF